MQVLKESKVKFVPAVGVHLLTSFWICLWFSHSSRSICLTLEKKKKGLLLILNLPSHFSQVFPYPAGRGVWAPFFIFPVVLQGWGLSLG